MIKKLLCKLMKYIANIISEVLTWCHTTIEAPTLLTATLVPPDIDLAWVDNSDNETGFYIWRSTDGTNFEIIDTVPANTESYTDTTVVVDQEYWYQVQAYNDDATSNVSNTVSTGVIITDIEYGILYNWYATTDVREICSAGWHIPLGAELTTLRTYLGGSAVAGGPMKEIGETYWTGNIGATNSSGFNGRGAGSREAGNFGGINGACRFWSISESGANAYALSINALNTSANYGAFPKAAGLSIRPLKDSTSLSDGETGTYTDPSGYVYRTICIGTQEWVADNIKTQHYRNGDPIPEVTDNGTWAALATGALCAYDNDWNYV
jgi:uncharacterized protein (TIGR02145 family)